jgi:hypothetical protein
VLQLKAAEWIQVAIAIILAGTLFVLYLNLRSISKQIELNSEQVKLNWKQIELTQILNQPICGAKELKVDKVRDNVIQISPVIKNYGKYIEKDASIKWKIDKIEMLNDPHKRKIENRVPWMAKKCITVLPEQEFAVGFCQFNTTEFNTMVNGATDSAIAVSLEIVYSNADRKSQRYSATYLITRLAGIEEDRYEVSLSNAR